MTGDAKLSPERARNLAESLAAYNLLMDEIVTESQYYSGKREDPERIAYLGNIVQRAAARRREAERGG